MAISARDFLEAGRLAAQERLRAGLRSGPVYNNTGGAPLLWYDQVFVRRATPIGTVESEHALRVGAVQNGLDVVLAASHANTGPLVVPEGTMLTLGLLEADTEDGPFSPVGPTVCVTAPVGGLAVDPDLCVARFALGSMRKPWCKVTLTVDGGDISGGTVDVALAYTPR